MGRTRPEKQKSERNQAIYEDRQKGLTFIAIGNKNGITPARARQIYEKIEFWRTLNSGGTLNANLNHCSAQ